MRTKPKVPVLVLCHPDNYLELYGDNVTAQFVMVPDVRSIKGELAAEKFISLTLPYRYRSLYPGVPVATSNYERLKPSEIARRRMMAELMRAER